MAANGQRHFCQAAKGLTHVQRRNTCGEGKPGGTTTLRRRQSVVETEQHNAAHRMSVRRGKQPAESRHGRKEASRSGKYQGKRRTTGGKSGNRRNPDTLHAVRRKAAGQVCRKTGAGNESCTRALSLCFPITFSTVVISEELNYSLVFRPRQQSSSNHFHQRPRMVHPPVITPDASSCSAGSLSNSQLATIMTCARSAGSAGWCRVDCLAPGRL